MDSVKEAIQREKRRAEGPKNDIDLSIDFLTWERIETSLPILAMFILIGFLTALVAALVSRSGSERPYWQKLKKKRFVFILKMMASGAAWFPAHLLGAVSAWLVFVKSQADTGELLPISVLVWVVGTVVASMWSPSTFIVEESSMGSTLMLFATGMTGYTLNEFSEVVPLTGYFMLVTLGWYIAILVGGMGLVWDNDMKEMLEDFPELAEKLKMTAGAQGKSSTRRRGTGRPSKR